MQARQGRGNSPTPLPQDDIMKLSHSRPARKQLLKRQGPQLHEKETKGSGVYNIWYNKWEGDRDRTRVKVCRDTACTSQ